MTEKSHPSHRPRYVQFRFEESLRKYQNPSRKYAKPNESVCKNCYRKSCDSGRESRLLRLCETRRLYHATSRERASEFSRKKQAIQLSNERASGHVSDFSCTDNNPIMSAQPQNQKSSPGNPIEQPQLHINWSKPKQAQNTEQNQLNWSISIRQTPIKQHIRQQLKNISSTPMGELVSQTEVNVGKVKDIEFHIGLVEELHQKIHQYITNQCSSQHQEMCEQPEPAKQPFQTQFQSKERMECMSDNFTEEKIEIRIQACGGQQEIAIDMHIQQKEDKQVMNEEERKEDPLPQINVRPTASQEVEKTKGRIEIKGERGSCYLSARILKKLLSSNLSPNRITNTVIRLHPYLGDVSHVLQILSQRN